MAQVVHDYGDICQAVTELAAETNAPITVDEFRTLNRCLDDAIAQAVTEYASLRERTISEAGAERLGSLVEEIRARLSTAMLSFELLRTGHVGIGGSTSAVLGRNLRTVCNHLDRSFAELRLTSGKTHIERVLVSELLEQVEVDGSIEADASGLTLGFTAGEAGLVVKVDRQLVAAALANILQNALKFSRAGGSVMLATSCTREHVLVEITDACTGLPPGLLAELLVAPAQRTADGAGLGVGLDIARRSVEACGGSLRAREIPETGCVFTMELPRG